MTILVCLLLSYSDILYVYCMCACLVTQLCPTLETPWIVAHQAPLSMEFSRQESWSWMPFPTSGDVRYFYGQIFMFMYTYTLYAYYSTIISLSNKFLKASVFQLTFGGCSGHTNASPFI